MASDQQTSDDLGFDRMAAVHRGAKRSYWLYAALLFLVGIALVIGAFTSHLPWIIGIITGVIALAVAILPARQAVERTERIEGLFVLKEEWQELNKLGDAASKERDQFVALMRRLYA